MGLYAGNAAAGTPIPSGAKLSPGGLQGPSGDPVGMAVGGDLTGTLPNPTLVHIITPVVAGDATHIPRISVDAKGRVDGVTTFAISSTLPPSGAAGGSLAGSYPNPTLAPTGIAAGVYGTGGAWPIITVTSEGRISAATLANPTSLQRVGLLGSLIGCVFNVTTDQPISIASARYRVTEVIIENTSPPLFFFFVNGNVYSAPLKGGDIVAGTAGGAQLNQPSLNTTEGFYAIPISTHSQGYLYTQPTLYLSLNLAAAGAGTGNIWIFGQTLA